MIARGGPGDLGHHAFDPPVAAVALARSPLARALVVARTHSGPRGQVSGIWKTRHVSADLGQDRLRASPVDARNRIQEFDRLGERERRRYGRKRRRHHDCSCLQSPALTASLGSSTAKLVATAALAPGPEAESGSCS